MHGRLKVVTTEEQEAAKREKLKVYLKIRSKIFDKREKQEYDEEALQLTGSLLERNPDFYTLWNYRREILLSMKPEKNEDEIKALAFTELNLTKHCLQKNPKSYAAWQHRYWSMEFNPDADWKKELNLCTGFLSEDERNFHCWDYRRLVAAKCCVSPDKELDYSTERINSNFSNYSAWHYRSTLLPIVHPGHIKGSLEENILMSELDLVRNAVFTDPDDQSAWFYHRWLLRRCKVPLEILNVTVLESQHKVAVLLSQKEKINNKLLKLQVNGNDVDVVWTTLSSYIPASSVWVCNLPEDVHVTDINNVIVEFNKGENKNILLCSKENNLVAWSKNDRTDMFRSELSATSKEVLENELKTCQQLLEMEPENKWALFTSILLMRALNDVKFKRTTVDYIKSLKDIDSFRKNYYDDFESKIVIEDYIKSLPLTAKEVNLENKNLSSIHHCDQFILIETINLSSNHLKSVFPLCELVSVRNIILDNNQLKSFAGLEQLHNLKRLSARNNLIESTDNIEAVKECEKLEELDISGNPVLENCAYASILEKIPALKITNLS